MDIVVIGAVVYLVTLFWPAFGKKPDAKKRENYQKRASNFKDGKFHNLDEFYLFTDDSEMDNFFESDKRPVPIMTIPAKSPSFINHPTIDQLSITWFGHSSLMIQMHGMNILVDPVFSKRTSPFPLVGMKRFSRLPLSVEELPNIDIVLLTHDHYDHLDYNTIKKIKDKAKHFVVPLGVESHLEKWNVDANKIHSMAWWEEIDINGLTIGCTPATHFTRRSINDSFATLWASFVLKDEYHQIFESGDGGFGDHFKQIYQKYGLFDLVLGECGQYNTLWKSTHMFPNETYQLTKLLKASYVIPIHWGSFKLSNHPWDDPVTRLVKSSDNKKIKVITPMIGETIDFNHIDHYQERWYLEVE